MRYFIAHVLESHVAENHRALVEDIAARFDLKVTPGYFPTHLTLKAPFEATPEQIDSVKNLLNSFSHMFRESGRPAQFIVHDFKHFERLVVALDVQLSAQASLLTSTLNRMLMAYSWLTWGNHEPLKNFHITIAKNNIEGKFDQIWSYLKQRGAPHFDLMFDNIALLKLENDAWVVDSMYKLNQ